MWVHRAPGLGSVPDLAYAQERANKGAPEREVDKGAAPDLAHGPSVAPDLMRGLGADAASERAYVTGACTAPVAGASITRVVPDGCTDLLWRRGELEIAGPDTAYREVPLEPGEVIVGVRLRPGAARPLLGPTPATDVTDAQPGLRELWGEAALRLSDSIAGQRDPWRVAAILAGALNARCDAQEPDQVAVAAARALDRPRPPSIASLAWELGYSERQLRRRVEAATGYGPKTLEQILRFRRTLGAASRPAPASAGTAASAPVDASAAGSAGAVVSASAVAPADPLAPITGRPTASSPDWSRIAAEQGYADQAHLSRQVRRWSGVSPRVLAAQTA